MSFAIELEREDGGRWVAEVPGLPGVLAYGAIEQAAIAGALALRVLADRRTSPQPGGGAPRGQACRRPGATP